MMKIGCMLPMMLFLGLSVSLPAAKTPSGLTAIDCKSIFPLANSSEAIRTLKSGIQWTEAWENGAWGPPEEFLGYVFFKSLKYEGKTIDVLVGLTTTGVISVVRVKGLGRIDEEFLAQFRGKTLASNFDLVKTPEDLLVVPAKLKAMKGNLALSESISLAVKAIALSANQVIK